jgi:hypothetical protein
MTPVRYCRAGLKLTIRILSNILIAVAAGCTVLLGFFLASPTPGGPDRGGLAVVLSLLQTPRWICLGIALTLCVRRGAFSWPPPEAANSLRSFCAYAALGVLSMIGAAT